MEDEPDADHDGDRIAVFETLAEARERLGENYAGLVFALTRAQALDLLAGKVIAFDIREREYAGFLKVRDTESAPP